MCIAVAFGDPCSQALPRAAIGACVDGHCGIPGGVSWQTGQITFVGQCCNDTTLTLTCPTAGTYP